MPTYLAQADYRDTLDGRHITLAAGELVDLSATLAARLVRQAPGVIDPDQPLTGDQADEARHRHHHQAETASHARRQHTAPPVAPFGRYRVVAGATFTAPLTSPAFRQAIITLTTGEILQLTPDQAAWYQRYVPGALTPVQG